MRDQTFQLLKPVNQVLSEKLCLLTLQPDHLASVERARLERCEGKRYQRGERRSQEGKEKENLPN